MTAPYNFIKDNFSTSKPVLTTPVLPGWDVVIKPDLKKLHFGSPPTMNRLQREGVPGVLVCVSPHPSGRKCTVEFEGGLTYYFLEEELMNAPRVQDEADNRPSREGGMKYDGDKPRMDLLVSGCPNALEAVGTVLTFGASKYAAHSWQTVPNGDERYLAALIRHLTAIGKGEQADPESGLSHLAHVACNALFILELECRKKTGTSDAI